jgi:hypothetical protein
MSLLLNLRNLNGSVVVHYRWINPNNRDGAHTMHIIITT